jgi:hypothetical protein
MEVLAVVGGVASITQLAETVVKISRTVIDLVDKVQRVPEELRKQQLTLWSIGKKLQLLHSFSSALPNDIGISPSLGKELYTSLLEL